MRSQAVDNNKHNCIRPIAKGAIAGGLVGYALKYGYGLTPQEKNNPEYVKVITKINNERTAYNSRTKSYLDEIKAKRNMTPAEDTFVKMFDGLKEGEHVKLSKIRNALQTLREKGIENVAQFKRLCDNSTITAKQTAKQCIKAYNLLTKHARPTGFFLISGAVTGAFIALINDIMRTEIKQ